MPSRENTQEQDPATMTWTQLIKRWMSIVIKKLDSVLIFIIALLGLFTSQEAKDKADTAYGKASSAKSVAVEAKKEAENKDLEQASYETLAATIADLQVKVDSVDERLTKLQNAPPATATAVRTHPTPSVSATASAAPIPTVAVIEPPSPPPPSWDEVKLKSNE